MDNFHGSIFLHLVKVGTKNISIPKFLKQWQKFKHTREYQDMVRSSVAKSALSAERMNAEMLLWDPLRRLAGSITHSLSSSIANLGYTRSGRRHCLGSAACCR